MTENEARKILLEYREEDDETGEMYGFDIDCLVGKNGDGFVFRCKADGVTYDSVEEFPLYGVYPDGTVLCVPM